MSSRARGSVVTEGSSVAPVSADSSRCASRVADHEMVDQLGAAVEDAAELAALGEPRARCSTAAGRRPCPAWRSLRCSNSEPGGPSRICVVAASGSSLRSPSTTRRAVLAAAVEPCWSRRARSVIASAARRCERVPGVARALVLVSRAEAAVGIAQELGLQVGGDEVDRRAARLDPHPQRAAAHLGASSCRRRRGVTGSVPAGKARMRSTAVNGWRREEADADAAVVGVGRELDVPFAVEADP